MTEEKPIQTIMSYERQMMTSLMWFQFLEVAIKMYIERAYDLIQKRLNNDIPYNFSKKDINSYALGRLCEHLSKLTHNKELISEIRELVPIRNKIAHKGYLYVFNDRTSENDVKDFKQYLAKINKQVENVFNSMGDELKRLESL